MKDCIFCKIINKELPTRTIYEDKDIQVIMNTNPITDGHLLILPKKHYENIFDIKEETIAHSIKVLREKLYPLIKEKLNCEGLTICENNFLGQEIKHFHIHVIPRYKDDNVDFSYNKDKITDLDKVFQQLTK